METRRIKAFLNQFLAVSLGLAAIFLVQNRAERGRSYWAGSRAYAGVGAWGFPDAAAHPDS